MSASLAFTFTNSANGFTASSTATIDPNAVAPLLAAFALRFGMPNETPEDAVALVKRWISDTVSDAVNAAYAYQAQQAAAAAMANVAPIPVTIS